MTTVRKAARDAAAATLQSYADRGVFRGFGLQEFRGVLDCQILWHFERPIRLRIDPGRGRLRLVDLLPGIAQRSRMDRELRRFLLSRQDPGLPEHRRLDPRRLQVRAHNRGGSISIVISSLDGDVEYATAKSIKLLNEIFLGFLSGPWEPYMVQQFGVPEE